MRDACNVKKKTTMKKFDVWSLKDFIFRTENKMEFVFISAISLAVFLIVLGVILLVRRKHQLEKQQKQQQPLQHPQQQLQHAGTMPGGYSVFSIRPPNFSDHPPSYDEVVLQTIESDRNQPPNASIVV